MYKNFFLTLSIFPLCTNVYFTVEDCGGGQVVRMLAIYSDDPSSNPADAYSFSVKFVLEKNENKPKKMPELAHF